MKKINCPRCNSANIVFRGYRHNKNGAKRLRKCKDCNRIFTLDDGFKRMSYTKEIVREAVKLYSKKDKSLSVVAEKLLKKFNMKISRMTILNWSKKFKTADF